MGLFWRLLAPKPLKKARRAMNPIGLLTPRPVARARGKVSRAVNPFEALEHQVVLAARGGKKRGGAKSASKPRSAAGGVSSSPAAGSVIGEEFAAIESLVQPLALRKGRQGEEIVLLADSGCRVAVTVGELLDPVVPVHDYDLPGAGKRLVAVHLSIQNDGPGVFSDSPEWQSRLIGAEGGSYEYNLAELDLPSFAGDVVTLSPGDTRSAYVAYAIRQSDRPAAMQIAFGVNLRAETGEWPLAPSTSAHVAREVAAVPTVSSAAPAPPEAAAAREVDLWLGKLTSVDVEQRQVAALALSRNLDDPRARDALIGVLKDPDFEVRTHAVRGLRDLADPALINAFRAVLQDPQPILRVDAIRGLLAIGDEEAVAALKSALSDSDPEVRHKAQIALAELGTA